MAKKKSEYIPTIPLPEGVEPAMDRQQVANILGCTRESVRYTEMRALAKLQRYCRNAGLRLQDLAIEE